MNWQQFATKTYGQPQQQTQMLPPQQGMLGGMAGPMQKPQYQPQQYLVNALRGPMNMRPVR